MDRRQNTTQSINTYIWKWNSFIEIHTQKWMIVCFCTPLSSLNNVNNNNICIDIQACSLLFFILYKIYNSLLFISTIKSFQESWVNFVFLLRVNCCFHSLSCWAFFYMLSKRDLPFFSFFLLLSVDRLHHFTNSVTS